MQRDLNLDSMEYAARIYTSPWSNHESDQATETMSISK